MNVIERLTPLKQEHRKHRTGQQQPPGPPPAPVHPLAAATATAVELGPNYMLPQHRRLLAHSTVGDMPALVTPICMHTFYCIKNEHIQATLCPWDSGTTSGRQRGSHISIHRYLRATAVVLYPPHPHQTQTQKVKQIRSSKPVCAQVHSKSVVSLKYSIDARGGARRAVTGGGCV